MDGSKLQDKCNEQGFNVINTHKPNNKHNKVQLKVRIGIIADYNSECKHCNSCLGFGTSVHGCDGELIKTTCGNIANCGKFSNKNTAAIGYIFVQ